MSLNYVPNELNVNEEEWDLECGGRDLIFVVLFI